MAISEYLRNLRELVGHRRLLVPSVTGLIFEEDKLLLVLQRDSRLWTTPGGAIEPDEPPRDAVIREVLEETGLLVVAKTLVDVIGGPEFVVRYENGDETQYVSAVFRCERVGGALHRESDETIDAGFFTHDQIVRLPLSSWMQRALPVVIEAWPPPSRLHP